MHGLQFLLVLAIATMFVVNFAYSQPAMLTVKVDKQTYGVGESITISGTVPDVMEGEMLAIQVFNPRNTLYAVDRISPNEDGTYSTTIRIGGKLGIGGTYTVKASYHGQNAQILFDLTGPFIDGCSVVFENNCFEVGWRISNENVHGYDVDPDFMSLILYLTTTDKDGELNLAVPRSFIDARVEGCEGDDDEFVVLVDGVEETAVEDATTSIARTLVIPIRAGAEEVEIIGTCIIPEFPFSMMIATVAIGLIVGIMRLKSGKLLLR